MLRVQKVAHAQRLFHVLVAVDGADAAQRGAEVILAQPRLLPLVLQGVDGQHHHGAVGDLQAVAGDGHALFAHAGDLAAQVL